MPYQTVVFDLDGTLLDTLEDLYRAANAALESHSLPRRSRDEVRLFVGNGVEMLIRRAVPAGTDEETTLAVLADFKTTYAAICEDHTRPYDGILAVLAALREKGIRVAVVSNKFDAATKALCAEYFGELVEVAIGERTGVRKKPAPDTLWMAIKELGVSPTETLYVGDADTDILTAKAAGVECASVTWGFRDRDFLVSHGANLLVDTPHALLSLILKG